MKRRIKEKKPTDEEIAKAILQSIEYSKTITYFDDWGNCKHIMVSDVLDLINRLKEQCSKSSYKDSWKNKFFKAQEERDSFKQQVDILQESHYITYENGGKSAAKKILQDLFYFIDNNNFRLTDTSGDIITARDALNFMRKKASEYEVEVEE